MHISAIKYPTPIKKGFSLLMVGVFLFTQLLCAGAGFTNTLAWAEEGDMANLAPKLRLTLEAFKDRYLARSTLLAHEATNEYISDYINPRRLEKVDLKELKDFRIDKININVDDKIIEQGIWIVGIPELLKNTGQLAHVGLGRQNGIPVIYVDSKYFYNEDVIGHDKDEIAKWEGKRRVLGWSYSQMREWIKDNPEDAKKVRDEFHKSSRSIEHIYKEIRESYKNFVDLDNIYGLYLTYGLDEGDSDVNIAAGAGIPVLADDEIALSQDGIFQSFIGNPRDILKKIRQTFALPEPKSYDGLEVTREGITFYKRVISGSMTWAFKAKDKDKIAKIFNLNLRRGEIPELGDDEIACSAQKISSHFISSSGALIKKVRQTFALPEPKSYDGLKIIKKGVTFYKRMSRTNIVWAFKAKDKEKIAKICNLILKKGKIFEVADDEVACSPRSIRRYFIGRDAEVMATIRNIFDLPEAVSYDGLEITRLGITFYKRHTHNRTVWAFKEKDKEKIAEICNLNLKKGEIPELADDEIALSSRGISKSFIGNPEDLRKKIIQRFALPEPKSYDGLEIKRHGITFYKRVSSNNIVWAFKEKDKEKIANICNLTLRKGEIPELGDDEIACSTSKAESSLSRFFIGGGFKTLDIIEEKFTLPNPKSYDGSGIKRLGITFYKRLVHNIIVWAFKAKDKEKIAEICNLNLRRGKIPKLADDEIACTTEGIFEPFIGTKVKVVRMIRQRFSLLDPISYDGLEIIRRGITFYKRMAASSIVWAFKAKDKEKIAKICKLELRIESETLIEDLGLSEVIALLGGDPLRLRQYLQIYHPELSQEKIDRVIISSLEGLKAEQIEEVLLLHEGYLETLPSPPLPKLPPSTGAHSVELSGRLKPGTIPPYLQLTGAYTRKIIVRQDGSFTANIPLPRTGEVNEFQLYAFNPETKEKSRAVTFAIYQSSPKEDAERAFLDLLSLREDTLREIEKNPERYNFLMRSVEHGLLRFFTYDEEAGLEHIRRRIASERSPALKTILKAILGKFEKITKMDFNLKQGVRLYFFQKYCIWEAKTLLESGARGVIIANEQGLGKTVTAIQLLNGREALIITPNSVVTTWAEEEEKFFPVPTMDILEGTYPEREKLLKSIDRPQVITNVEFTRGMTAAREELLSKVSSETVVVDEADYLGNISSQQSMGTRALKAHTRILLTATPFKRPSQICHILGFIRPDDDRFSSARAFSRAFPVDSREALNALFLLLQQHTLRVRKKDVFEEYDPKIPLESQSDKLPKKIEINPDDRELPPRDKGWFELTREQCESIRELFTDYRSWCRKHKGSGRETVEDASYYRYREGFFSKREALRQIMNNPAYIGRDDVESTKHREMDYLVGKELGKDAKRKILIFCRYRAQVEEYAKRYADYGVRTYYGGLKANADGYKINEDGKLLYYEIDEYKNFVLKDGKLAPSDEKRGRPIRALDYERILFQNDPDSRIMVATYDTGALGVTLTAADVVIYDDLAPTYRDQYHAGDRAHRIDNNRKKYDVTYYWLQAHYPDSFLKSLPSGIRATYFGVGTYDEVHLANIRRQGRIFHRIMDGIGSQEDLDKAHHAFIRDRMPFLFKNGEDLSGKEVEENDEDAKKGSPAELLGMVRDNEELLKNVLDRTVGITAARVADLRTEYSRGTINLEFKLLKSLEVFVPVEGKPHHYRFSDMFTRYGEKQNIDLNYTKTLINAVCDIRYKIGRKGDERPLHRGDIPQDEIPVARELVKMAVIHQINLDVRPIITESKVLWHILENDILSESQKGSFAQKVNNFFRDTKLRERIYILKPDESIKETVEGIKKADSNAIFDVALSSVENVDKVPDLEGQEKIKMLVFKGSAGDFRQIEGVIAALRALHLKQDQVMPTLLKIYSIMKGAPYSGEIPPLSALDDPREFARRFIFDLPPISQIPVDDIPEMKKMLLKLLVAA